MENIINKDLIDKIEKRELIVCENFNSCYEALKKNIKPLIFIIKYDFLKSENFTKLINILIKKIKLDLIYKSKLINNLKESNNIIETNKLKNLIYTIKLNNQIDQNIFNKYPILKKYFIIDKDEKKLKKLSSTKTPYSIVGIFYTPENIKIYEEKRYEGINNNEIKNLNIETTLFAFENIQDPNNLGNIIRTIISFNFKTLITIGSSSVYHFSQKVIRSSSGNIFHLNNIFKFEKIETFLTFFKNLGFKFVSLSLNGENILNENNLFKILSIPKKIYIFGNEGRGISEKIIENSDYKIKIPINENVDSLNVGNSVAIIAWENYKNNIINKNS